MDYLKSKPIEGYFQSLDGLRALAILLVILNHFVISLPEFLEFFRARGHLGVEIFFAISGFLVMRSYHICFRKYSGDARTTLKEFYMRRGLRIFFPYYLTLLGVFVLVNLVPSLAKKIDGINHILVSFPLYFYNYAKPFAEGSVPGVLNIMWSLAFEEQFYILLGLCCVFFRKKLGGALLALAIFSVAIRFMTVVANPDIGFNRLQFETHMRLDAILLGCLGYIHYQAILDFFRRQKYSKYLVYLGAFTAFVYAGNASDALGIGISFTLTSIFFTGMVLVILADRESVFSKFLENRILVKMGKVSYEIYLLHQIVNALLVKLGISRFPMIYGVTLILGSCGLALLWYQYINLPIQKKMRGKFSIL